MKNKSTLILSCLLTLSSTGVQSSNDNFKRLKDKVDELENSVIKDFDFEIPKALEHSHKKHIKLSILLEEKFVEQKKLFYHAEAGLFQIEDSLVKKVEKGVLTKKEADSLLTSVEYARRIIIYTRKTEVHERYSTLKEKISFAPNVKNLYQKFSHMNLPGDCHIENTKLDSEKSLLSFDIRGIDQDGEKHVTSYSISQNEIDSGMLSSRFERGEHLGNRDKVILRFNKMNPDESNLSFSLFENKKGEFYHAEFFHDHIYKPFINIFGLIKIGNSAYNKEIKCFKGPSPASVKSEIKANYDKSKNKTN